MCASLSREDFIACLIRTNPSNELQKKLKISSGWCREPVFGFRQDLLVPLLALTDLEIKMTKKTSVPTAPATPMTASAAARIQSATAKSNGGSVPKGSFSARATSTAAKSGRR